MGLSVRLLREGERGLVGGIKGPRAGAYAVCGPYFRGDLPGDISEVRVRTTQEPARGSLQRRDPGTRWRHCVGPRAAARLERARDSDTAAGQRCCTSTALARYFVPREDVRLDRLGGVEHRSVPACVARPASEDHVRLRLGTTSTRWFEEDEQLIAHGIDPYHSTFGARHGTSSSPSMASCSPIRSARARTSRPA